MPSIPNEEKGYNCRVNNKEFCSSTKFNEVDTPTQKHTKRLRTTINNTHSRLYRIFIEFMNIFLLF